MRLRQVVLVAREPGPVVDDLFCLLGIDAAFNDPEVGVFGLENSVMAIGDTFLEVVSPVKENTTAGRFLERRKGNGGYMVIVQTEDLEGDRARVKELGVRIVLEADRGQAACIHLHPRDVGGAILSLDEMRPPETWLWGGPGWENRAAGNASRIIGVEIQAMDPGTMGNRWSTLLDRPLTEAVPGLPVLKLEQGEIHFLKSQNGRGDGVSGVVLEVENLQTVLSRARDRNLAIEGDRVTLCGTDFRFVVQQGTPVEGRNS